MNPLLKVDLDVDATDTNTKAEGTRSVKRGETLKMVHGKQAGETRTADVKLSIDSPVNIPLPSDFPQWKGPGKVEESNGQLIAQYNGNQSGNITVNPFSANAAMQAVNVVLVPENETELNLNLGTIKSWVDTINGGIKKLYPDTNNPFSLELSGAGKLRHVDLYNDGKETGKYAKFEGTLKASLKGASFDKEFPLPIPGAIVALEASVKKTSVDFSASFEIDQSKQQPYTASGTLSASTATTVAAGVGVGISNVTSVTVTVGGGNQVTVSGTVKNKNKKIILDSKFDVTGLQVSVKGEADLPVLNEVKIFDLTCDFETSYENNKEITLYELP